MTTSSFDRDSWDDRWRQVLRDHADSIALRPPNHHLVAEAEDLAPGRALDAGCGHGSETLWLAAHGWRVTAVDFAPAALEAARTRTDAAGPDIGRRVEWLQGDLSFWQPQDASYDLVYCLYVHTSDGPEELVRRLAGGVGRGGTLLLVGHQPIDPSTGEPTAAADQVQVSVQTAHAVLNPDEWELEVAEERVRPAAGTGVDAVIRARRRA